MVTCKRCFTKFEFKYVQLQVDNDGCYFLCPVCWHRNKLMNVGDKNGPLEFVQLDD